MWGPGPPRLPFSGMGFPYAGKVFVKWPPYGGAVQAYAAPAA